jgi:thiol-disulfide isomerase/thioredoxin/ribosomal 50S subunit-associated protein YjgA (DUF615 family)
MKKFLSLVLVVCAVVGSSVAADLSQFKTADDLWKQIEKLKQGPEQQPQTREEAMQVMATLLKDMDEAVGKFLKDYPTDARSWEAKLLQVHVALGRSRSAEKKPDFSTFEKPLQEIIAATAAPAAVRANASFLLLQLHLSDLGETPNKEAVEAADKQIMAFVKEYPDDQRSRALKFMRADLYTAIDPAKEEAILKELAADTNPRIARRAQSKLDQKEALKKPVELKFTAVDGSEVDVAKLRGKVVLVDFWATWCGPCQAEVPNVVAAYKKYHDKGFEVVGISLDEDKDEMLKFTKEHGMTWPQYFDGKGWGNAISFKHGIQSIPAMWVLDKKGMIRSTEARGEALAPLIEKLLAEQP